MLQGLAAGACAILPFAIVRDLFAHATARHKLSHIAAVLGVARRVAGDGALAEDATQEVFVRLWRDPQRYDPARGELRSYLMVQVRSRALARRAQSLGREQRFERRPVRLCRAAPEILNEELPHVPFHYASGVGLQACPILGLPRPAPVRYPGYSITL